MSSKQQGEAGMTVAQRINDFITAKRPLALCNKCIADGLGLINKAQHPAPITATLGTTSDFTRGRGTCGHCHNIREVIAANPQ